MKNSKHNNDIYAIGHIKEELIEVAETYAENKITLDEAMRGIKSLLMRL